MGLSEPFKIFGIHSITCLTKATYMPLGILKILGSANLDLSGDFEDLYGGSNRYAWASEQKTLNAELTASIKAYDNFIVDLCLGASSAHVAAEATGNVSTLTNKNGTSVVAATGLAGVAATSGDEADLKTGFYTVYASASNKIKIYCSSDVDFAKGTDTVFTDDTLICAAETTITGSGSTHAIADLGLTFTAGASAVNMTVGDTATFWVRKINTGSDIITVGAATQEFVEFAMLAYSQRTADGNIFEIFAPKCKATGMPIKLDEKAWSVSDFKVKLMYDATEDCILKLRKIKG